MKADFSEVARHDLHGDARVKRVDDGDWVSFEDFEAARQKLKEMAALLIECRDALPAISMTSAILHNVDLNLANRIENCLSPWEIK